MSPAPRLSEILRSDQHKVPRTNQAFGLAAKEHSRCARPWIRTRANLNQSANWIMACDGKNNSFFRTSYKLNSPYTGLHMLEFLLVLAQEHRRERLSFSMLQMQVESPLVNFTLLSSTKYTSQYKAPSAQPPVYRFSLWRKTELWDINVHTHAVIWAKYKCYSVADNLPRWPTSTISKEVCNLLQKKLPCQRIYTNTTIGNKLHAFALDD